MDIKHYKGTETTGYYRYVVRVELEYFGDGQEPTRTMIEQEAYTELEDGARGGYLDLKIDKVPIVIHGAEETKEKE